MQPCLRSVSGAALQLSCTSGELGLAGGLGVLSPMGGRALRTTELHAGLGLLFVVRSLSLQRRSRNPAPAPWREALEPGLSFVTTKSCLWPELRRMPRVCSSLLRRELNEWAVPAPEGEFWPSSEPQLPVPEPAERRALGSATPLRVPGWHSPPAPCQLPLSPAWCSHG